MRYQDDINTEDYRVHAMEQHEVNMERASG